MFLDNPQVSLFVLLVSKEIADVANPNEVPISKTASA
jgi:hypothetical protein